MMKQFVAAVLCLGLAATSAAQAPVAAKPAAPPNGPAQVTFAGRTITVRYDGATNFTAEVSATRGEPKVRQLVDTANGRITQVVSWVAGAGRYTLRGTVHTTGDALAVDADPREDGVPVVRHSVGPSYSRLNRAVYARDRDWLLSVDFPASARITPVAGGDSAAFELVAEGYEITLRFRPRFYQKHRGLAYYEPWTYRTWPGSVAGWTSWFAFKDRVTEADIQRTADVMAERLKPYGYDVLQIDDGFQRSPISVPDNWLNTNAKFPSGLGGLQRCIAGKGLTAGLWTNTAFHDSAWAYAHPQYFVRDAAGKPSRGNWVGYVMDGSPATMRDLVLPVYSALKQQGWGYYKVDALRHLRYEGFNSHNAHFTQHKLDRVKVYRDFTQQIRTVIGRDAFLLASWGPRPELAGIIDATRLGDDGFGYGGFAQFNSFNNVVWRNDPDHIELSQPDGRRAATLTSLTGSLLMLTDKPETYRGTQLVTAQRIAPVLVTRPGQVYDVDPSRTDRLWMVESEVSGAGPRPFEADQRLQQTLYQTDIARPFERWTVLARTTGAPQTITMEDLGLDTARVYVAFDFWNDRALGAFRSLLSLEPVTGDAVQVVCLRERVDHPQLLSTNRHVTCGGVDLQDVRWDGSALRGLSTAVAGDAVGIAVTEPPGWEAVAVESPDARAQLGERMEAVGPNGVRWRRIVLVGPTAMVRWAVQFRQTP
jgi:alpha-galactosidase